MRLGILCCVFVIFTAAAGGCQDSGSYFISLKPDYKGWVYLLKSTDSLRETTFYPDSLGIVYIPEALYNDKVTFLIKVDDSVPEKQEYQFYNAQFYDEANRKITYSEFFFPFTKNNKEARVYTYKERRLPEFKYYYYSGKIDRSRLFQ